MANRSKRRKTEFKPVKFSLNMDPVTNPIRVEGLDKHVVIGFQNKWNKVNSRADWFFKFIMANRSKRRKTEFKPV